LPLDLVRDLAVAGCFRMLVPRTHGGGGFDLVSAMSVFEELSRADASVGWTAMIGAGAWVDLGGLPRATFDALYADGPDAIIGGVFSPAGTAVPVDGGYRVSGRWAFASGCEDSHWLFGNCMEDHGGAPQLRTVLFSPDQIKIEDTWSVSGLCGTGSHHLIADDVFVRAERTCLPFADPPCLEEPLLRMPMPPIFAFGVASVAVGIAQGALEDILALSASKVPLLAHTSLATNPLVPAPARRRRREAPRGPRTAVRRRRRRVGDGGGRRGVHPGASGPDALGDHLGCDDRGLGRGHGLPRGGRELDLLRQPAPPPVP
jgi:alkylation response protein AidB-like acyl-CoA dehydrogenase